jgi:hypothetical protein
VVARMRMDLESTDFISFTSDAWTSSAGSHSLLSLTAHFLSPTMRPEFLVLGVLPLHGHHTAENMSSLIENALEKFGIPPEKCHMFVRDAASNMIKTTRLLGHKSFDCFSHKLQLVSSLK